MFFSPSWVDKGWPHYTAIRLDLSSASSSISTGSMAWNLIVMIHGNLATLFFYIVSFYDCWVLVSIKINEDYCITMYQIMLMKSVILVSFNVITPNIQISNTVNWLELLDATKKPLKYLILALIVSFNLSHEKMWPFYL